MEDTGPKVEERLVRVMAGPVTLEGNLRLPEKARGVVLFAHGSGSSRHSPRNRRVARMLNEANLATFLIDPLTPEEEMIDLRTAHLRFDISLLAERLSAATDWLTKYPDTRHLRVEEPGALGEVDPFRSLLRRIFLPIDMHESQKASPPLL